MAKDFDLYRDRYSHIFDLDEYECSCCQAIYKKKYTTCHNCGARLIVEKDAIGRVDKTKKPSWLLESDDNIDHESSINSRKEIEENLSLIDYEMFFDLLMEEQEQM